MHKAITKTNEHVTSHSSLIASPMVYVLSLIKRTFNHILVAASDCRLRVGMSVRYADSKYIVVYVFTYVIKRKNIMFL